MCKKFITLVTASCKLGMKKKGEEEEKEEEEKKKKKKKKAFTETLECFFFPEK